MRGLHRSGLGFGVWLQVVGLWVFGQLGMGATWYVAPAGRDSNPGNAARPFQTVWRGVNAARAGDTIILKDGIYGNTGAVSDGTGGMHGYATPVPITKAGRPDAWITMRAEHKWGATLDCETTSQQLGCDVYIYLKKQAAYWDFEDIAFTRGAYAGLNTNEGASHVRVKGCKFEHIGNRRVTNEIGIVGVGFGPPEASDWWIEGNVFENIGRTEGRYPALDHGIYADGSDATIIGNVFANNAAGWGIQTSHGSHHWLIANNTFAFPNPAEPGQIMLWDGDKPGSVYDITIRNNIFYEPMRNAVVSRGVVLNCIIENNLTDAPSVYAGDKCMERNNKTGEDPKFVKAASPPYDFRLREDSPARGWAMPLNAEEHEGAGRLERHAGAKVESRDGTKSGHDLGAAAWQTQQGDR